MVIKFSHVCWMCKQANIKKHLSSQMYKLYGSPERQMRKKKCGDSFSKFELICVLSCVYDFSWIIFRFSEILFLICEKSDHFVFCQDAFFFFHLPQNSAPGQNTNKSL